MKRAILKWTALFLVLSLILCLFSGCELPPEAANPSEAPVQTDPPLPGFEVDPDEAFTPIDPNYFELLAEDCDVTVYTQEGGVHAITFMLLSAQPLGKYDVTIGSDQGVTRNVRLISSKSQVQTTMPYYVYLCYKNFDWKACAQMMQTKPASAKLLLDSYQEEWQQCKFNRLFSYQVKVYVSNLFSNLKGEHNRWVFPEGQDTVAIQDLTVTVKGQSKTYHPRCLRLTNAPMPVQSTKDLEQLYDSLGFSVQPSAVGDFYYNALWPVLSSGFQHLTGTMVIDQIGLPMQEGMTVGPCPYAFYGPFGRIYGGTLQENEFIRMDGAKLKILLHWTDPAMANKLGATGLNYFALYYETAPNKPWDSPERRCFIQPIVYNIFSNAYEYYAWAHDGVDILPYYRDYVAVVQEVPKA